MRVQFRYVWAKPVAFRAGMFRRFALISTSTRYCWPGFMPQSYHAVRCFRNRQRFGGAVVLEDVERWPPGFIQRDHLPIDDSLVRQRFKRFDDGRIPQAKVVVVPRAELNLGSSLDCEYPITIEF